MTARVYAFPYRPMGEAEFCRRVGLDVPDWVARRPAGRLVRLPSLEAHLARRAAPAADALVGLMGARRTLVGAVYVRRKSPFIEYACGWNGVKGMVKARGRHLPPLAIVADGHEVGPAVFVMTDHAAGWVTLSALALGGKG
jgi:hypothetical protein